jgi:hypothetical protein
MTVYLSGSKGPEVERIQFKLKELGYYKGPIDGDFGGGTERAVKDYQRSNGLTIDGKVGPETWANLFNGESIPKPEISQKPLAQRVLALTGSFETGKMIPDCFAGLSGDFDGQGISFGVLQWNFGQGSLQPLLKEMNAKHADIIRDIFDEEYETLIEVLEEYGYEDQMKWVRSIQHPINHRFYEPWRGFFKTLGRIEKFQKIQTKYSSDLYQKAIDLCRQYELWSERALALMFDIKVQNGSISRMVRLQIEEDFGNLEANFHRDRLEVEKMRIIANRRAEASRAMWIEDVRSRKLCVVNGEGIVHGINYHIENQFNIALRPFA